MVTTAMRLVSSHKTEKKKSLPRDTLFCH